MSKNRIVWLWAKLARLKGLWGAFLAYVVLSIVYTYPAVLHLGDRIIGDFSDHALLSLWDLWWVKHAVLTSGLRVFHTNHIFYPGGISLYFHTLVPLYGLLSIPIQLALNLVIAHNVIILASFVVSGLTSFLLVRYVVRDEWAAFVAGAAFTFSSYHTARAMGHLNLVLIEWLPLYALLLLKSADSEWFAILSGICLSLIMLVDLHYLLYCALLTGVFALYRLWRAKGDGAQVVRCIKLLALVGLSFVLVGLPALVPMVREAASSPGIYPGTSEVLYHSADLASYFIPSQYQFLYGDRFNHIRSQLSQGPFESQNYVGYACLALAIVGVRGARCRERRMAAFWAVVVLFFWILSLGPILHILGQTEFTEFKASVLLPYAFVHNLPLVGISRAVGRMSVMVLLGLVVLSGFGVRALLTRVEAARVGALSVKSLMFVLVLGVVLFENLPNPFIRSVPEVPSFYESLASDSQTYAVLDLPTPWRIGWMENYQFYQTVHEKKLSVGFHARSRDVQLEEMPLIGELAAQEVDPTPRSSHFLKPIAPLFRYVVLHKHVAGPVDELESALSNTPKCYEGSSVQVYCPQEFQHSTDYVLNGQIQLKGYEVNQEPFKPGDSVRLTLFWRCVKSLDRSYSVFTHLVDSQGRLVSQHDGYPQDATCPTARWVPGQWVWDEHELAIPREIPPGTYRLFVGMYDFETGQRMEAFSGNGERVSSDRISLGSIKVEK